MTKHLLAALACLSAITLAPNLTACAEEPDTAPIIQSRTANYWTHDLEATTRFYTQYLGLVEAFQADVTAAKSRETYGITGDAKLTAVGFFPPDVSKEKRDYAAIVFFHVEGQDTAAAELRLADGSAMSHTVLAHRVKNVDEIERRMKAAGVPIVSPLSPSSTGKSRSMTVLDPNGIRIETYEYIQK